MKWIFHKKTTFLFLTFFIPYFLFFILVPPVFASTAKCTQEQYAQCGTPGGLMAGVDKDCHCCGKCEITDFLRLGRAISDLILKFVGVVALIFFIVGGIVWVTSSGNQERVKQGKKLMTGTIIGIFIVLLAWQSVNLVICGVSKGEIAGTCKIFGTGWNIFPKGGEGPGAATPTTSTAGKVCADLAEGAECKDPCNTTSCLSPKTCRPWTRGTDPSPPWCPGGSTNQCCY